MTSEASEAPKASGRVPSICARLLRRKSLAEARSLETPLKRCLTVWHLTFYGIAHMAGAGIYVLAGTIVRTKAGPGAAVSFLICAAASLFTGLCYVEFSTFVPRAGSCYTFTYLTLGELPAFVVGWTMIADIIIGMASVSKAFSSTVDALAGRAVSNWTMAVVGRLPDSEMLDPTFDLVAAALIFALMLLTVAGASVSLTLNVALSGVQCCSLLLIAVFCFVAGSADNWAPAAGGFFPFGASGVVAGATVAIFAFSGFEAIANAAEECADPRRSLPVALLASLGVITLLYFGACLGVSYLQHYADIDAGSPFVVAFRGSSAPWMQYVAAGGTLLATGATKLAAVYVLPRMLYALAADGVIFSPFAYVHPRLGVPLVGLAFGGCLAALLALVFNIATLANFVSMGVLLSYLLIGVDLFYLRYFYFHRDVAADAAASPGVQFANLRQLRSWASRLVSRCPALLFCLRRHSTLRLLFAGYLISCLAASLLLHWAVEQQLSSWPATVAACAGGFAVLATGAALCLYEPHRLDAYAAPLMPLPPLLTLFINCLLITRLQWLTWLRFIAWMLLGLVMYATYGFRHAGASASDDYQLLASADAECNGDAVSISSEELAPKT